MSRMPEMPTAEEVDLLMNPTSGAQTPTPWRAQDDGHGRHFIVNAHGHRVALFDREADRDFALFWANTHVGVIRLLRSFKHAFEFVQRGSGHDAALATFAASQAEAAAIWEKFFTTLGASARHNAEDPEQ